MHHRTSGKKEASRHVIRTKLKKITRALYILLNVVKINLAVYFIIQQIYCTNYIQFLTVSVMKRPINAV